jgi:HEAT repeat protein
MKRRLTICLTIATVVVVAAFFAFPTIRYLLFGFIKGEPFANGRPVSYWIDELTEGDPASRQEAAKTLGKMGQDGKCAVPALVQVTGDIDPHVRRATIVALGNLGPHADEAMPTLVRIYEDQSEEADIRWAAVKAFGRLGTRAQEAVPVMIRLMSKDTTLAGSSHVQMVVTEMGPVAVPPLAQLLQDDNPKVRAHAAVALNWIGPDAKEAVPALIRALQDEDNSVRRGAAFALMRIGSDAKDAIPHLTKALQDEDSKVRDVAAMALKEVDIETTAKDDVN